MIAALAMRKLQALHLVATPGVKTTTDVVVTVVQDLDRALVQAPTCACASKRPRPTGMPRFKELSDAGEAAHVGAPTSADEEDPEARHFRFLHSLVAPRWPRSSRCRRGDQGPGVGRRNRSPACLSEL